MTTTRDRTAAFDPFSGPPRLHGARRVGVRPGTEVIHALAATGARPLRWQVHGLPDGIAVDDDGILRGTAPVVPGDHRLEVQVANGLGVAESVVELCVGDRLALTPPMGWNSWNVYASRVSADVVVRTAEYLVRTGLRDLGYSYVNIDDHWHAERREPDGTPAANPVTFPDGIAAVADRVHELGLKLGIYSDAAELTCGDCFGSIGHEEVDARTYAGWGVDLLKYDYCHAPFTRSAAVERYGTMSRALEGSGRSIVFSVCEWGLRKPWEWAPELGASMWRTTPDIFDTFSWTLLGVRGIARRNLRLADHAGPGRWNDPDMLLVGNRGRGGATGALVPPWKLRRDGQRVEVRRFGGLDDAEARSHMTLWAMMAAPLLASHDLAASDPYDLALLSNPEVLAVDQDPLGRQGRLVDGPRGVWQVVKPLSDGAVAVSLTNVSPVPRRVTVPLATAGVAGPVEVTDAWAMRSLGRRSEVSVRLRRHASELYVCRP